MTDTEKNRPAEDAPATEGAFARDLEDAAFAEDYESVTFVTDDGAEETFLHIMTFPYEGAKYAALVPEAQADAEEPEVVFVKLTKDEKGDAYIPVENEVLLEELFAEFSELLDEQAEAEE